MQTHTTFSRTSLARGRLAFIVLVVLIGATMLMSVRPVAAASTYFPETQHNLLDPMHPYWNANGGLPVFGYPISEAVAETNRDTGTAYLTQYFERNRFEVHPENAAPYTILLGLLGKDALALQGRDWTTFPKADPSAAHYVPATGHAIAHGPFWQYYRAHGLEFDGARGFSAAESVALFGLPLSEPHMETNSSGDTVLTQWFERARFEDHGARGVLLGLLGKEVTAGRTGEAAFQPATPLDEAHAAGMQLFGIFNTRRQADYNLPAVRYRADLQQIADEAAQEFLALKQSGGNTNEALDRANARLAGLPGSPGVVYATVGGLLEAKCKGVDPSQPIASAYSAVAAKMSFTTLTLGVSQPHQHSCGRAITIVYITGFDY